MSTRLCPIRKTGLAIGALLLFASAQFAYTAKIARVFVDSEASLRYNENKESEQGAK